MAKHFAGIIGTLTSALIGVWLMIAPFALGYQASGAEWADPTIVGFWTGLALLLISLAGVGVFVAGLVAELRERGVLATPSSEPQHDSGAATTTQRGNDGDLERVLAPLAAALLEDLEADRRGRHQSAVGDRALEASDQRLETADRGYDAERS